MVSWLTMDAGDNELTETLKHFWISSEKTCRSFHKTYFYSVEQEVEKVP